MKVGKIIIVHNGDIFLPREQSATGFPMTLNVRTRNDILKKSMAAGKFLKNYFLKNTNKFAMPIPTKRLESYLAAAD